MMERRARARYESRMRSVAELERLAQVARHQARITTNLETSEVLLEIACEFATAAKDRRIALEEEQRKSLVTAA